MKNNTFCVCNFDISPCFFTQILSERARWMRNLILHPTSTHTAYFWQTPLPKNRNTWKNVMMTSSLHFSGISCFWGSDICQKYAEWVLFGCGIQFRIQRALLIEIWVKPHGNMSKIQTKKVVFSFFHQN